MFLKQGATNSQIEVHMQSIQLRRAFIYFFFSYFKFTFTNTLSLCVRPKRV